VLFQGQAEALALTAEDLAARLALVRDRVAEGAALASDAAALEAELIGIRQRIDEAQSSRSAALAVLRDLTGLPVSPGAVLALPMLDAETARIRQLTAGLADASWTESVADGGRPEFEQIARTQVRAETEARLARTARQPIVSVFGQAGVGRPSPFDFLSSDVAPYGLVGVRVRWAPIDWGQSRRDAEAASLQTDIAQTEADALAQALRRQVESDLETFDRFQAAIPQDARVIALREDVLRVARGQFEEGVLLAPDYVDRLTDLAAARLSAARHRVERVQAQARLLSTLGRFPEADTPTNR
jgi:outer membrane protein TolC